MSSAQSDQASGKFTGRHMLFAMLLFFGVIITVNMTMAVLASRSWTGLVVKNSYVASQHFNEDLQAARVQRQRGWQAFLRFNDSTLQLTLQDRQGRPVALPELTLNYGRPAFEQADRITKLKPVGEGVYRGKVAMAPGVWALSIRGDDGELRYRRDSRLRITQDGISGKEE